MTPDEFKRLRLAAGLSIRRAARALDVAPQSIQRWEGGARRIPADAADRLRRLAFDAITTTGGPMRYPLDDPAVRTLARNWIHAVLQQPTFEKLRWSIASDPVADAFVLYQGPAVFNANTLLDDLHEIGAISIDAQLQPVIELADGTTAPLVGFHPAMLVSDA